MTDVAININDNVRIKLQPRGMQAYRNYIESLGLKVEDYPLSINQQDGCVRMPLWEVMQIFGPSCFMGPQPPFETTIWWESK
jgi:hypothetical protein